MLMQLIFIYFLFNYFQKIFDFLKNTFLWIKILVFMDKKLLKLLLISYILIIKQKIQTKTEILKKIFYSKIEILKQKWYCGIDEIDDGRYLLKHFIDGEKVFLIVKKNEKKIIGIYDENFDKCLTSEILPFLKIKQDTFYAQDSNEFQPLVIVFSDDERETISLNENN
jgi:hypothetical protein